MKDVMKAKWHQAWKTRARKKRSKWRRLTKAKLASKLAIGGFAAVLALFFLSAILFAWYAKDLPQPDKIVRREGFSTKIYDL